MGYIIFGLFIFLRGAIYEFGTIWDKVRAGFLQVLFCFAWLALIPIFFITARIPLGYILGGILTIIIIRWLISKFRK